MLVTEYLYVLSPEQRDRLRVRFMRERQTIAEFVVQYEAEIKGRWYPVVRYDTAHGFAHRDLLHPDGRAEKQWLPWMSFNVAMTYATQELKTAWRRYRGAFEEELPHDA